ncbi:DoxX family protein [Lacibacterium aquatile]|uniref:DoxX family protein n=1 Tax=Lacibacterium aquatile TaxID=1168082 RepID=A0ABW5DM37_9PROT
MITPAFAIDRYRDLCRLAQTWVTPLVDLWIRFAVGLIFWRSGLQKISDWPATLQLFHYEYQVPLLPPGLAAVMAAATELGAPVLLFIGLASRLAALPLLCMTLVIQFVLGAANPAFNNSDHFFWMILLAVIITRGPGRLSLDHLIATRLERMSR